MVIRESLPFTRWGLCLGVGIFLSGIFAAVFGRERLGRLATVSLELCVTLFAGIMLAIIVSGYSYVLMQDFTGGTVIQTSLGYLTRGSFHSSVPDDWIFSLTLPYMRAGSEVHTLHGFGAPLWAILIATAGACLIALQFLIRTAADRSAAGDAGDAERPRDQSSKDRADQLLAVAFAPLGAIFVYQSLIALDITGFVLVGTVLLASGLSSGTLINMATRQVVSIIERAASATSSSPTDSPQARRHPSRAPPKKM